IGTAVDSVAYQINQNDDGFDLTVGRRLEDHFDTCVGAGDALHVDGPFLLPRESCVLHFRDHRFRLANRNEVFANYLAGVAEADAAPPKRHRVDRPSAVRFRDGLLLPEHPSARAFALEQQHRQTGAADDGCRIDAGERRLQRRQGGDRTSCRRGGDLLAPELFVFAIVVGVIAVAIVIRDINHVCFPPRKPVSASENTRAVSTRPRTGACAFSTRTSETPERFETINSCGILRPRAFARSSSCLGERITSASTISSWSKPRLSRAICAAISSRQWRSARPAESA